MSFITAMLAYLFVLVFIAAIVVAAVFIGIRIAKNSDAKKAAQAGQQANLPDHTENE